MRFTISRHTGLGYKTVYTVRQHDVMYFTIPFIEIPLISLGVHPLWAMYIDEQDFFLAM